MWSGGREGRAREGFATHPTPFPAPFFNRRLACFNPQALGLCCGLAVCSKTLSHL